MNILLAEQPNCVNGNVKIGPMFRSHQDHIKITSTLLTKSAIITSVRHTCTQLGCSLLLFSHCSLSEAYFSIMQAWCGVVSFTNLVSNVVGCYLVIGPIMALPMTQPGVIYFYFHTVL